MERTSAVILPRCECNKAKLGFEQGVNFFWCFCLKSCCRVCNLRLYETHTWRSRDRCYVAVVIKVCTLLVAFVLCRLANCFAYIEFTHCRAGFVLDKSPLAVYTFVVPTAARSFLCSYCFYYMFRLLLPAILRELTSTNPCSMQSVLDWQVLTLMPSQPLAHKCAVAVTIQ
jgi:hypothetical protein